MTLLLGLLWHALTHKRSVAEHECGAKIVWCRPRFWRGHTTIAFIPWPGAMIEHMESGEHLAQRLEAHHSLLR